VPRAGETWCAVSVRFYDDPKMVRAGRDGRDLYLAALCWSVSQETDGLIPRETLGLLGYKAGVPDVDRAVDVLIEVGAWVWEPEGPRIHAFAEWQQSAAQRRAQRAKATARQQASRERRKAASQGASRVTGASVTVLDGDGDGDGEDPLPSPDNVTSSAPVDNPEEDEGQQSKVSAAMRHVGLLLAERVGATHPDRYAAEVVGRGAQRVVLEQLAGIYPTAGAEWLARRALDLPTTSSPPRSCPHCDAPTGHRGGTCPTLVADPVLAQELRAEEAVGA
jgi:hypothetical protein